MHFSIKYELDVTILYYISYCLKAPRNGAPKKNKKHALAHLADHGANGAAKPRVTKRRRGLRAWGLGVSGVAFRV